MQIDNSVPHPKISTRLLSLRAEAQIPISFPPAEGLPPDGARNFIDI
jgi:hypothetical protein